MLSFALQSVLVLAQTAEPGPAPRVLPSHITGQHALLARSATAASQDSLPTARVLRWVAVPQEREDEVGVATTVQGALPRARLGVGVVDDSGAGVCVNSVAQDSAAERAGLRAGDRILSLDSRPTDTFDELVASVDRCAPGVRVRLRVRRDLELALDPASRTTDGRFALGVSLNAPSREPRSGLQIAEVVRGSPAARAGVLGRDSIVAIDSHELAGYETLVAEMKQISSARTIVVTVERDIEALLGAPPGGNVGSPLPRPGSRSEGQSPMQGLGGLHSESARRGPQGPIDVAPRRRLLMLDRLPGSATPDATAQQELRAELRELSSELQALRDELAQLRSELQALRQPRRSR